MPALSIISLKQAFEKLTFVADRTSESSADHLKHAFAELAAYRNGAIFIGHYAGNSEWERHSHGDEIVMCLEGETVLTVMLDSEEMQLLLKSGEMFVVPEGTWHRFETPEEVKILTVTPQPTDHSVSKPV